MEYPIKKYAPSLWRKEELEMYNPYGVNMERINKQIEELNSIKSQMMQPAPINNFINTNRVEMEGRVLAEGQTAQDTIVQNRTILVDELNKKISIKEIDGTISKEYEIVIPKTKEELKIEELENYNLILNNKLKEMEMKLNEYSKPNGANNEIEQPDAVDDELVKPTTKKSTK